MLLHIIHLTVIFFDIKWYLISKSPTFISNLNLTLLVRMGRYIGPTCLCEKCWGPIYRLCFSNQQNSSIRVYLTSLFSSLLSLILIHEKQSDSRAELCLTHLFLKFFILSSPLPSVASCLLWRSCLPAYLSSFWAEFFVCID